VRALPTARISSGVCVINNSLAPLLLCSPSPPVAHLCDSLEVAGAAAVDLCPEWTRSEVLAYVAIYLRVAGFCALGSGLYVAAGARRRLLPTLCTRVRTERNLAADSAPSCSNSVFWFLPIGIISARKLAKNLRDYRCEYV
jgi:hypothetical protein